MVATKQKVRRRAFQLLIGAIGITMGFFTLAAHPGSVSASGDASFGLAPSSGSYQTSATITMVISETSAAGDDVNAVQANLSYSANLQYDSISLTGPFTLCAQQTGGSGSVEIGCASTSTVSGTQSVASVTFTVESAGSASVDMASGSNIDNSSGASVWNGTLPSATFTLTTPTSATGSGSGSPSSGSSSGSSSDKTSSSSSSTKATSMPTSTGGASKTTTATGVTITTPKTASPITPAVATTAIGSVTVVVTNSSGSPVSNAKVVLDGHYTEYTNTAGKAGFSTIAVGAHTVQVMAPGHSPTTEKISLTADQDKLVALKLKAGSSMSTTIMFAVLAALVMAAGFGVYHYVLLPNRATSMATHSASTAIIGTGTSAGGPSSTTISVASSPAQQPQTIQPTSRPPDQQL